MTNGLLSFDTPAQTVTMSSREISELTGKRHPDVVRDLKNLMVELEQDVSNFAHIYKDTANREQTEYALPKRETLILVSGYNAKVRAAIIDRWQQLEQGTAPKIATQAELMLGMAQTLVAQERKLVEVDSRVAALETKLLPGATMHHSDCPADSENKSRALRRKQKETGISLAVCERVFALYEDSMWKGETCVNPNPAVPGNKPCRVYKTKDINASFRHFLKFVKPVGNGYFTDKDFPTRFRVP